MTQIVEAVKTALKNEVKSEVFFRRAAAVSQRDDSRMLFIQLADMEARHTRELARWITESLLTTRLDALGYVTGLQETLGAVMPEQDLKIVQTGTPKSVIQLAERLETEARDNFLFLAREADEPEVRLFCTKLSQVEEKHLDELKRLELALDIPEGERPAL